MINANELRRGNWILEDGKPIRVDEIRHWYFGDAEPIELSPEILEKAGFELENAVWWNKKYKVLLYPHFNGFLFRYNLLNDGVVILGLHHLQNLYFALTGEELTINL